jgi:large subunit ribosomal protein L24
MHENTIFHVRKNDIVQVKTGKDKGKTGKVLRVVRKTGKVVVEKVNVLKRHTKPTGKAPGGIVEKEGSIQASNVLLFCDKCGKGVRTVRKTLESGKKARSCRKCSTQLDK